uniref:Uncharacterized protein n=1 Tax=Ananas comosus var. bracteatus TaxID=296719 RepID=A0A6V7NV89_ANACO|nr:unnamed protein product [Ananas comosus var. bracteatus]
MSFVSSLEKKSRARSCQEDEAIRTLGVGERRALAFEPRRKASEIDIGRVIVLERGPSYYAEGLGLPKESMIYYTMPIGDISNGLKLVEGDKAVLDMLKCHDEFGVILLYIVSPEMVDEEALNELTEDVDVQGEQLKNNNTENEVQKDADGQGKKDEGMGEAPDRNISEGVEENNEDAEKDAEAGSESDSEHEWSNFGDSDEDSINDSDFFINVNNVEEEDINDGIGQGGPTTSRPAQAEANDKGTKTAEDNDQSSDYQPSDDLDSMSSSDEDGPSWPKYPVFNKSRDLEEQS